MPRRLLAYVWPAIALDPEKLLQAVLAVSDQLSISLPGARPATPAAAAPGRPPAGEVLGLSARSGVSNPAAAPSREVPSEGEAAFIVAALLCVAVMAMLAFTVRRELRAMYRWPL